LLLGEGVTSSTNVGYAWPEVALCYLVTLGTLAWLAVAFKSHHIPLYLLCIIMHTPTHTPTHTHTTQALSTHVISTLPSTHEHIIPHLTSPWCLLITKYLDDIIKCHCCMHVAILAWACSIHVCSHILILDMIPKLFSSPLLALPCVLCMRVSIVTSTNECCAFDWWVLSVHPTCVHHIPLVCSTYTFS
jgi:hypothetical protein